MSLVQKLRNAISAHPSLTTTVAVFGIGLAVTFVIGSVIGVFDHSHTAFAHSYNGGNAGGAGGGGGGGAGGN